MCSTVHKHRLDMFGINQFFPSFVLFPVAIFSLQVRLEPEHNYGAVQLWNGNSYHLFCADGFDDVAATVVCRTLGFEFGVSICCSAFGILGHGMNIAYRSTMCYGDESSIRYCSQNIREDECQSGKYASALCLNGVPKTELPVQRSIELSSGYTITSKHPGPVTVRYLGVEGFICGEGFTDADATVVCKELGWNYTGGFAYKHIGAEGIPWLSSINCTGNETSIGDCRNTVWKYAATCENNVSAGAYCYYNEGYRFSLIGSGHSRYGRLDATVDGTRGAVCGPKYGLTPGDASVLCREIGFQDGQILPTEDFYEAGTRIIHLSDLRCSGSETSIRECPMNFVRKVWRLEFETYHKWRMASIDQLYSYCSDIKEMLGLYCYNTVRLSHFYLPHYGILEVNVGGEWSAVCDQGFNKVSARVACRDMGFTDGRFQPGSVLGPYNGRISVTNLSCVDGDSILGRCTYRIGDCPTGHYVTVYCSTSLINTTNDINLRIVGDGYKGTLEANKYGFWSPICPEGWDDSLAYKACRQLEFSGGDAAFNTSLSNISMVLGNFKCGAGVDTLAECEYSGFGQATGCQNPITRGGFMSVAGVNCFRNEFLHVGLNPGPVKVAYKNVVGNVCPGAFGDDLATPMCVRLGFKGGFAFTFKVHENSDRFHIKWTGHTIDLEEPWLLRLNCTGDEFFNGRCQDIAFGDANNCTGGAVAGAYCHNGEGYKFRLTGSDYDCFGRVQFSVGGNWGDTCGTKYGFNEAAASVLCRQLGFENGHTVPSSQFGRMESTDDKHIEDIKCRGNETSIWDCPLKFFIEEQFSDYGSDYRRYGAYMRNWYNQHFDSCHSQEDKAAVYCYNYVRLASFHSPNYGIVELKVNGSWSAVCDTHFNEDSARKVCRQLGFRDGTFQPGSALGAYNGSISVTQLSCTDESGDIGNCSYTTGTCLSDSYVTVYCDLVVINKTDSIDLRIVGEGSEGALEANTYGFWGPICPEGWDNSTAPVACRQLGFSGGVASDSSIDSQMPMVLGRFQCAPGVSTLGECRHSGLNEATGCQYPITKYPMPAAGVLCYGNDTSAQLKV